MTIFAEYYHDSTGYQSPVHLIPACGSDSVLIMDRRYSLRRMIEQANKRAHALRFVQPGYKAFRIMRSPRIFGNAQPITELIPINRAMGS